MLTTLLICIFMNSSESKVVASQLWTTDDPTGSDRYAAGILGRVARLPNQMKSVFMGLSCRRCEEKDFCRSLIQAVRLLMRTGILDIKQWSYICVSSANMWYRRLWSVKVSEMSVVYAKPSTEPWGTPVTRGTGADWLVMVVKTWIRPER